MNWEKIKKDCPLSWKLLDKTLGGIGIYDGELHPIFTDGVNSVLQARYEIRNLYDFFDEKGVYPAVYLIRDLTTYKYNIWIGKIIYGKEQRLSYVDSKNRYHSREETEIPTLTRSFSILESQLQEQI